LARKEISTGKKKKKLVIRPGLPVHNLKIGYLPVIIPSKPNNPMGISKQVVKIPINSIANLSFLCLDETTSVQKMQ
jgi:hypothetical protein